MTFSLRSYYRPDLHLHTTASDGILSPEEICHQAGKRDVDCIAITDHDTLEGIRQLVQMPSFVHCPAIIPGIELSCGDNGQVHMLGYNIPLDCDKLNAQLDLMVAQRTARAMEIIQRLGALGIHLPWEEFSALPAKSLGRAHIARALVAHGYVASIKEGFARYLSHGRPAYVPRPRLEVRDAIQMLRGCGAVPVLAHPGLLPVAEMTLEPLLYQWQSQGLMGIEAYHPANGDCTRWDHLARRMGLLVTGGSDFHGMDGSHGQLGDMLALWPDPYQDMEALLAFMS